MHGFEVDTATPDPQGKCRRLSPVCLSVTVIETKVKVTNSIHRCTRYWVPRAPGAWMPLASMTRKRRCAGSGGGQCPIWASSACTQGRQAARRSATALSVMASTSSV